MTLRPRPPAYIEARDGQSKLIEQRLTELGSTWSALADAVGISRAYFQTIRRGKSRVKKPETVEKICGALGIRPDDFYLAGGYLPPDVVEIILRHPQLIDAVRKAGKMYDAQQEATDHDAP